MLSAPSSTTTSHRCLELLMNSVLLCVSLGRVTVALGTLEGALFGSSEKPFQTEFKGTVNGHAIIIPYRTYAARDAVIILCVC